MAREHEAGKSSLLEILRFAKRERDGIVKKMDEMKCRSLLQKDKATLLKLLDTFEAEFDSAWQERKRSLTKHAKFCLFTGGQKQLCQDIHELHETIKVKTTMGESVSSVNASKAYLEGLPPTLKEMEQRMNYCNLEGNQLANEMPVHQATLKMGLTQLLEKWSNLQNLIENRKEVLHSASQYFHLYEESESFLRGANNSMLDWSRRVSTLSNKTEAHNIKAEMERFTKTHRATQSDILFRISSSAGQVFGQPAYHKTQQLQKEHNQTFEAINNLLLQIENYLTHQKSIDEDNARNKRLQAETEANIRAAKAEAEAARRAAKQAEEARRAAEEATMKAKSEMTKSVTKVICHETQTEAVQQSSPPPKFPPPPPPPEEEEIRPVAPLFTEYLQDKVLKEGSRCEMKARVSGVPTPAITWFKDGVPVREDNSDYKARFTKDGLCSLAIEETFVEDSANWSVRASNQAGYAESHAKLTVQEIKPVEEQCPPKIVEPLQDGEVQEGCCFEFRAKVTGKPMPHISWFKDGICVDRSRNFTIGEQDGHCVLRIDKAYLEDSTEFKLKATSNLGQAATSAKLRVKSTEPTELPVFQEPLPNVEVVTGQPIVLECQVHGLPRPEVQWFHHGNKLVKKNGDTHMSYDGVTAMLKVAHAFPRAGGQYICRARNAVGEASSTSIVTVKAPLPPETSDSEAALEQQEPPNQKPAFYVPLRNLEALSGEEVVIECVIVGRPEPEVIWYRNNMPVKESHSTQLLFQGDTCKLVLLNCREQQSGEYKVRAVNPLGECRSTCQVKVSPPKAKSSSTAISTQTTTTLLEQQQQQQQQQHRYTHKVAAGTSGPVAAVAPKFITPIQGSIVEEGAKVVLEGVFQGQPKPKIKWTYNEETIQESEGKYRIDSSKENKSRLVIDKVPKIASQLKTSFFFGLEGFWGQPHGPNFPSP